MVLAVLLSGCSATVGEPPTWRQCTDTRDGEQWYFNSGTIHDAWANVLTGQGGYQYTDSTGRAREITAQANAWIKCEKVAGP